MAEVQSKDVVVQPEREVAQWSQDQIQLIKDTVAVGTTDDEFKLFLYVCQRSGLDPLAKQIHAIKRWNSTLNRKAMTVQTGIDGYRVIADRTRQLAGIDDPVLKFDNSSRIPSSATVTVYRMIEGERVPFTATAFYDEYVQTNQNGEPNSMWAKMPKSQLAKCAEALALRKAFPNDLSGIYTHEEMQQADSENNPAPSKEITQSKANPGDYQDGFPSKYGTKEKPNYCVFCDKNHIVKDDRITKDDASGKYGSVICKGKRDNGTADIPAEEKADPRIAKLIAFGMDDLLEIVRNTEIECFGDPDDEDVLHQTMQARYKAVNLGILAIGNLESDKNNKGCLSRYINHLTDTYQQKPSE